ncbi:MAG: UDP-N-acetylglucosamine 2-epimerase (non-hydrolyzing), partial [Legionellales bacterium]|nr:UDP-N-acetylglucosamine 2-epimerase (non-hydrolyzing) [Legionellales bacterium]
MASFLRIVCLIGTRPEVIKMAPVVEKLHAHPQVQLTVISTAQHRQLLDDMLQVFKIDVDVDLNMMRPGQSLAALSGRLFLALDPLLTPKNYDVALVHGDTTSSAVAAQVCFYHQLPIGHVEAGLRSYDFYHPFPEEWNRMWIA